MTTYTDAAQPPRRRSWMLHAAWGIGAATAFFVGVGAGASGDATPAAPTPEPVETVTAEPVVVEVDPSEDVLAEIAEREAAMEEQAAGFDVRESDLDEREDAITGAEAAIEEGTIPGTGIFLVGENIEPGTYRGDGSGGNCYWARLSGTSGDFDDLIANDLPGGPTVVTIARSDVAFETTGCAEWVKQ